MEVMQAARVIVWEETDLWAAHLRLALGEWHHLVYPCRTGDACDDALTRWPASLLAVEVSAERFAATLAWLTTRLPSRPAARWVALATPDLRGAAAAIREMGAIDMAVGTRSLRDVADLARRHVARAAEPDLGIREAVYARLPWGD